MKGLSIMKNYLKKILCGMICLMMMLSCINVSAAYTMQVDWRGDYSDNADPKLIVEFKSPALYKQQFGVVVYPASVTNPTSSDYLYVKEVTVSAGETKTLEISILDRYTATNGKYKVDLKGSGHMSAESTASIEVDLIKPNEIPGLLNEFKNSTSATFSSVLTKVIPALQLTAEADPAREAKRINIMFNIQSADYNGIFSNLENIRDAWQISDIIAYLTDSGATAEEIKAKIEANSGLLGIDINDANYKAYIDTVCQNILDYQSEYNGGNGVLSMSHIKGIVNQYVGMYAINAASVDDLHSVFARYEDYFEIPADVRSKYDNDFIRADQDKALRSLYNKNFTKNSQLVAAFVSGVNGVVNNTGTTPNTPVVVVPGASSSSGGGTSAGMTGGSSNIPTPPTPAKTPTFSDVPSNHWAYSYVTKLATNGTIGGYDDGSFKPNNNVTREEFVKMIIGATGLLSNSAQCDFADVSKDAWFYGYVASAFEKEIVSGVTDTSFGVGRNITRQDVAVIAARILTYMNAELPELNDVTLTDIDSVSDYAQESVKLLNGMGIIGGFDDGSFMPHNALTRAEAAAIISRLTANL